MSSGAGPPYVSRDGVIRTLVHLHSGLHVGQTSVSRHLCLPFLHPHLLRALRDNLPSGFFIQICRPVEITFYLCRFTQGVRVDIHIYVSLLDLLVFDLTFETNWDPSSSPLPISP